MANKYKLNVERDVDKASDGYATDYILNLPDGFRFYDEVVHTRGFDSMRELRKAAKEDVIECECANCLKNKS